VVFDSLIEVETQHLKALLQKQLSPDMELDRLSACEQLCQRKLRQGGEGIHELAHNLERLLDKASPKGHLCGDDFQS